MERRMLINAIHAEECRIAIVEGETLVELELESQALQKLKGNIYRAKISRIEPSLQAAFVDIGAQRNGFLQINDVHPSYFRKPAGGRGQGGRPRIQDVLEPGQELVVQVVKEERELKGATLTTYLSLPGRYVVIMPGSDRGGVSRKISDSEQRKRLRNLTQELLVPAGMGIIIRTAGLDRSLSELGRDLALQLKLWEQVLVDSQIATCPALLYKESDLSLRVIRDYFTPEVREILIDEPKTFQRVREFVGQVMPRYRSRVKLYEGEVPIFTQLNIEGSVIETLKPEVKLKSGGAIVIEALEALVAIDVNSGKATAGENIEDTAFRTNLEAAEEVARQLRLRDLGGLIVVDFIDMLDRRHRAAVERKMREAIRNDKARIEIGKLSRFGMLEMSRQRLRGSLESQSYHKCGHCNGTGWTRAPESVALEALRKVQSAVAAGNLALVKTRLSPGPALYLLNNKKKDLARLESEHDLQILILADGRLAPDEYEFEFETKRAKTGPMEMRLGGGPVEDAPGAASPSPLSEIASAGHGDEEDEPETVPTPAPGNDNQPDAVSAEPAAKPRAPVIRRRQSNAEPAEAVREEESTVK